MPGEGQTPFQTKPSDHRLDRRDVLKRQTVAVSAFLAILVLIVALLYWSDRRREWRLREEQAAHRLELAYELITRDLRRVRSDALFVANQYVVRNFDPDDEKSRRQVENEFANFLRYKQTCQQIRLIDTSGHEAVRVDLRGTEVAILPESELQDKGDRYYVHEALRLNPGEVFVSEFDLNQEYGVIEQPLNPVIRFVTPVGRAPGDPEYLLVVNYRGGALLRELAGISLPGQTFLIRSDGHYLLGPNPEDAWGWLLGHRRSFDTQFDNAWNGGDVAGQRCVLTDQGAVAFRQIPWQRLGRGSNESLRQQHGLILASYLPFEEVFRTSNQLLGRLLILVGAMLLPVLLLTRFWAVASSRRQQQNNLILESEARLRELSSSLVRIQEAERRAISREIHDQLGQQVTAINLELKLAQREIESRNGGGQLRRAIDDSEQLLETLHDFATRVRPVELDDLGLHDALESHLWEFKVRTGIDFEFNSNLDRCSLPAVISENVYRLIQEALNNVVKHADATRVTVSVMLENSSTGPLDVCVQDDGVGVSATIEDLRVAGKSLHGKTHLGILGMRERIDLLGGSLEIFSSAGDGTTIRASVPVNSMMNTDSAAGG